MNKPKIPDELKHLRTRSRPDEHGIHPKAFSGLSDIINYYNAWCDVADDAGPDSPPTPIPPPKRDIYDIDVDWRKLAESLIEEFFPGVHEAEPSGRPTLDRSELVSRVDCMRASGEATSILHACDKLQSQGLYLGVGDLRRAYYRERKKLQK